MVAAVLSGNRNFEGRINPLVKANYLASPPLVVAYALAGTVDIDLTTDPLGQDSDGQPVYLRDIWPTDEEVREDRARLPSTRTCSSTNTPTRSTATRTGRAMPVPTGAPSSGTTRSTYIKKPPYFDADGGPRHIRCRTSHGMRVLALLGDSVTTDHISPAGSIAKDSPAGRYLIAHGVEPEDFNSYGARRGNHEVMVRGTLANIRLRNQLAPGTEGGWTVHLPDGEQMSIYDASVRYQKEGVPLRDSRRQGVRLGLVARLGGQGRAAAGRARGDRRKLRAHPPHQPGGHGRAAAGIPGGRERRQRWV